MDDRLNEHAELIAVRTERDILRYALSELVGATNEDELRFMAIAIRGTPAPNSDKIAMLNAIQVLLDMLSNHPHR